MLAHPLHVPLSRAGCPALRWSMRLTAGAHPCCMLLSSLVSSVRSTSACTGHDVYALVYEAYSGGSPLLHALKHGRGLRHGNQRGWRCLRVTTLVLLCRPPRHGLRQRPFSALRSYPSRPAPRGTGRHALSSASTPGSPTGRGNRARRYHWPILWFHVHPSDPRRPRGRPHS